MHNIVGFMLTPDSAEEYFIRVMTAEKVMGKLTEQERMVILKSLGSSISMEDLVDLMKNKRVLVIKNEKKA